MAETISFELAPHASCTALVFLSIVRYSLSLQDAASGLSVWHRPAGGAFHDFRFEGMHGLEVTGRVGFLLKGRRTLVHHETVLSPSSRLSFSFFLYM